MDTKQLLSNRTLADLNALHHATTARLDEFLQAGNVEQAITYAKLQAASALAIQQCVTEKLEAIRARTAA